MTPVATRISTVSWTLELLPQTEEWDTQLQRVSNGRLSALDIAGLLNIMSTVPGRNSGIPRSVPFLRVPQAGGWLIPGSYFRDKRMQAWQRMFAEWLDFAGYEKRTERPIPVFFRSPIAPGS